MHGGIWLWVGFFRQNGGGENLGGGGQTPALPGREDISHGAIALADPTTPAIEVKRHARGIKSHRERGERGRGCFHFSGQGVNRRDVFDPDNREAEAQAFQPSP